MYGELVPELLDLPTAILESQMSDIRVNMAILADEYRALSAAHYFKNRKAKIDDLRLKFNNITVAGRMINSGNT